MFIWSEDMHEKESFMKASKFNLYSIAHKPIHFNNTINVKEIRFSYFILNIYI